MNDDVEEIVWFESNLLNVVVDRSDCTCTLVSSASDSAISNCIVSYSLAWPWFLRRSHRMSADANRATYRIA
jgi:hypothetical protein